MKSPGVLPRTSLPLCLWLVMGCGAAEPPGSARAALTGKDGDRVVTTSAEIVNRYATLAVDAAPGDRLLQLSGAAALQLTPGDLLLIYQTQGATINTSATPAFGAISNLGSAGRYELVTIESVNGELVTLDAACGLKKGYSARGAVQVIRVPQFRSLRVARGAGLSAPPWNGRVGGVIAVHVQQSAVVDGAIDASGLGFRGGAATNQSIPFGRNTDTIAGNNAAGGGEKGESIAGDQAAYERLGVRYGRGAPANGGGGASSHNAAGGGGGGADNGRAWTGTGVMDGSVTGAAAWALDPAYRANGNRLSDSSGGGRGGYSYSVSSAANNPSPLVVPPGDARWGADRRRAVGGLGGRGLKEDAADRVFFGGGGGGGDGNNDAAAPGARGGGVVLLIAGNLSGDGALRADGAAGPPNVAGFDDGGGGAGGGGAVVLQVARPVVGVSVSAAGGKGGDQPNGPVLLSDQEAEGPGGGGGGGAIFSAPGDIQRSATGGAAGVTRSPFMTQFPSNGATTGASGALVIAAELNVPSCLLPPATDDLGGTAPPTDLSGGADGGGGGEDLGAGGADLAGGGPGKSYAGSGVTCAAAPGAGAGTGSPWGVGLIGLLGACAAIARGRRRHSAR